MKENSVLYWEKIFKIDFPTKVKEFIVNLYIDRKWE